MVVKKGQYSFAKLYVWKKKVINKMFNMTGVYTTDIAESKNKVSIGVKNKAVKKKVTKKLSNLNIPKDAVLISKTSKPVPLDKTLRSYFPSENWPTLHAGVQTAYGGHLCTMGPIVRWQNGGHGFITASHCSNEQGQVDSTKYYTPTINNDNYFAGTEIRDPAYTHDKCWKGTQIECRQSDALLVLANGEIQISPLAKTKSKSSGLVSMEPGTIFRTTGQGSIHLGRSSPPYGRYHITEIDNFITKGTITSKVGRTTGWTKGSVIKTCVAITESSGKTVLCQNEANFHAGKGDSGAPVFENIHGEPPPSVTLDGIVVAGTDRHGKIYYKTYYSTITRIKTELSNSNIKNIDFKYHSVLQ
jgi:hypothetical protein